MIDQLTESESERAQLKNDARNTEGELEEDEEPEDTNADGWSTSHYQHFTPPTPIPATTASSSVTAKSNNSNSDSGKASRSATTTISNAWCRPNPPSSVPYSTTTTYHSFGWH